MAKARIQQISVRGSEIAPGDILGGRIVETSNRGVVTYADDPALRAEVAPAGTYVVGRRVVSAPKRKRSRANVGGDGTA